MCKCNDRYKEGKEGYAYVTGVKEALEKAFNEEYSILLSSLGLYYPKLTSKLTVDEIPVVAPN